MNSFCPYFTAITSVIIRAWSRFSFYELMNFRNEITVEADQPFVDGKRVVVGSVFHVAEEKRNSLRNLGRITACVEFVRSVGSRPLPKTLGNVGGVHFDHPKNKRDEGSSLSESGKFLRPVLVQNDW